jgi:hypothetical protein
MATKKPIKKKTASPKLKGRNTRTVKSAPKITARGVRRGGDGNGEPPPDDDQEREEE